MNSSYCSSVKTYRRLFSLLLGLTAGFIITGCSPQKEAKAPQNGLHIVSLSPAATSILIDLSLAENLTGVDRWSAALSGVPTTIPSFDMITPDAERIMALSPDLIFVSSMTRDATGRDPFKPFSQSGTTVHYIPVSKTLDAIKQDVRFIAQACNAKASGEAVIHNMETAFERITTITATIPEYKKKSVYFEIGAGSTLYSFGNGVYLDELVSAAGGINIFSEQSGWLAVNAEQVLAKNPEILFTNVPDPGAITDILTRPGWHTLAAVQKQQVYKINYEASSQPAPTIILALHEIAQSMYPTYFAGEAR